MHVLLSIKPTYAEGLLAGTKQYEYRKVLFAAAGVRRVFLYASSPVQRIVGEIEIDSVLTGSPSDLWEQTGEHGGVSRAFFFDYFAGHERGHAIKVKSRSSYQTPVDPYAVMASFHAPQSFMYLTDSDLPAVLARPSEVGTAS